MSDGLGGLARDSSGIAQAYIFIERVPQQAKAQVSIHLKMYIRNAAKAKVATVTRSSIRTRREREFALLICAG